jgi:putative membrane protein
MINSFRQKLKTKLKFKNKNHWLYILIAKPDLYVQGLLKNTFIIGFLSFWMTYAYLHSTFHANTLPTTLHSMIAVVIGLLLVFRTNSAYDRWWEARKLIDKLSSIVHLYSIKVYAESKFRSEIEYLHPKMVVQFMLIKTFLQEPDEEKSQVYRRHIMQGFVLLFRCINSMENKFDSRTLTMLETSVKEMIEVFNSLERIKDAPIPVSYSLHIKISVMLYILSLPFGLFASFGLWSTVYVMIIYYIIAGIEIISNEIENPFTGDPNDLPMDDIFNQVKKDIEKL